MTDEAGFAYLFKKFPVFAQTFIAREIEGMDRHGCHPSIYALLQAPPSDQEGFEALRQRTCPLPGGLTFSMEIIHSGLCGRLPPGAFWSFRWIGRDNRRRREALWLGPRLRARGIRHVHVHFTGPAARTAWWLKQDFGMSYSITAHANDFLSDPDEHPGLERLLGDAAFVVAVSDYSRALLADRFPKARIVRIYNGMRLDSALPPAPITPPLLAAVGRLVEKKGYPVLIEACRLLREHGTDFRCEIIGDGPMENELRRQIEAARLSGVVKLSGPRTQPQIRQSLSAATAFVLPCVEEKSGGMDILPTVITEAMSASLPVVSTFLAGIPEMVLDGQTGFLVQPGDARAIADAVRKLLANREAACAMGATGRRYADAAFSENVTIPQLLEQLREAGRKQPSSC